MLASALMGLESNIGSSFGSGIPPHDFVCLSGEFDGSERINDFHYLVRNQPQVTDIVIASLAGTLRGEIESRFAIVWCEPAGGKKTGPVMAPENSARGELLQSLARIFGRSEILSVRKLEDVSQMLRPKTAAEFSSAGVVVVSTTSAIYDAVDEVGFILERLSMVSADTEVSSLSLDAPHTKSRKTPASGPAADNSFTLPEYRQLLWDSAEQITAILCDAGLINQEDKPLHDSLKAKLRIRINDYFAPNWNDFQGITHSLNDALTALSHGEDLNKSIILKPWAEAVGGDILNLFVTSKKELELDSEQLLLEPLSPKAITTETLFNAKQQITAMVTYYLPELWLPPLTQIQSKEFSKLIE